MQKIEHEQIPPINGPNDLERAFMLYVPARQAYPNALELGIEADIFLSTQNANLIRELKVNTDDLSIYFFEHAHKYGMKI